MLGLEFHNAHKFSITVVYRVSETQLQVTENLNWITLGFNNPCNLVNNKEDIIFFSIQKFSGLVIRISLICLPNVCFLFLKTSASFPATELAKCEE